MKLVVTRTELRWAMNISLREHKINKEMRHLAGVEGAKGQIERRSAPLVWPRAEKRKRLEKSCRIASSWE